MSLDQLSLQGKRALVCGASKGIGRATAKLLAARGAHVIALARSQGALEELVGEIHAQGGSAELLVADLDNHAALSEEVGALGTVHIVVHNTGGPKGGPLHKADPSEISAAIHRHVLSAHTILQAVLPGMSEAGYGRWVNVLSTSVREPIPNLGVSNLTRAAMASWSKTLTRELPPGVTINNVLPGYTDTDRLTELAQARAAREGTSFEAVQAAWISQVPEGRLAQPSETAEAIAFLVSPAGGYIRGLSLPVDGGRLRSI